jgi:hypothetical protein
MAREPTRQLLLSFKTANTYIVSVRELWESVLSSDAGHLCDTS